MNAEEFPEDLGRFVDYLFQQAAPEYQQQVKIHNDRLLEKIRAEQGEDFCRELTQIVDNLDNCGSMCHAITPSPKGEYTEKPRWLKHRIKGFWNDILSIEGDYTVGIISVQLSEDQYLEMIYTF